MKIMLKKLVKIRLLRQQVGTGSDFVGDGGFQIYEGVRETCFLALVSLKKVLKASSPLIVMSLGIWP